MKNNLTPKQEKFCQQFLIDLNGTKAAERSGYSKKTANEQAARLLANVSIQSAITKKRAEVMEKTQIEVERTLEELGVIGYADTEAIFGLNGEIKPVSEWPKGLTKAIQSLDVQEIFSWEGKNKKTVGKIKKVRFWNKAQALEMMMKYDGLFEKDNRQKPEIPEVYTGSRIHVNFLFVAEYTSQSRFPNTGFGYLNGLQKGGF